MTPPIRVFCSHAGIDKPRVEEVARRLAAAGIDPWLDKWEIAPGDSIIARINAGLADRDCGLIFLSATTLASPWVQAEVDSLTYGRIKDGKRVIPVMLDPQAPVPELLRPLAWVDANDSDRLIDAIRGRSTKPPIAPPPAAARERLFEIRLEEGAPGRLRIAATLDGEPQGAASAPLSPDLARSWRDFLASSLPAARLSPGESAAQRDRDLAHLGDTLAQAVLPAPLGAALGAAIDRSAAAGERLRLEFAAPAGLLALPFESIRLPDGRVAALEPGVCVLRRPLDLTADEIQPLPGPLRILVAIGAPDEGRGAGAVLDYERELQTILDAVDQARRFGNAEVRILEVGHPDQIRDALLARAYHCLHLSGHGRAGVIALEDEDGHAVPVDPALLAAAIRAAGRRPPPLVFLAACLSGAGSDAGDAGQGTETGGFAQGLLAQGLPLVLAMQTSVSDWYATRLAGCFYDHLSRMETPLASRALAQARRQVESERRAALARGERRPGLAAEYATPALFAAAAERPLADYALPKDPPPPPAAPPAVDRMPQLRVDDLIGRRAQLRRVLRVLRDRVPGERHAGVTLSGIGGVGKSALAGRVMARLAGDGWVVAAAVGRWGLGPVALALGGQLAGLPDPELARIGTLLLNPELPDQARLQQVLSLLANHQVLLVLDNFEDNLKPGGDAFLDQTVGDLLTLLLHAAGRGKLLITSRYPVPDTAHWLADQPLGPLSPAETRKLFYRLPALAEATPETLTLVLRHIGGHPRMLEYLDAILRQGAARLPAVAERLEALARRLGLDPERLSQGLGQDGAGLDQALQDALRLGAEDILLDQLLDLIAHDPRDLTTLQQAAAFGRPVAAAGLAFALADGEPTADQVAETQDRARRLIASSLLTPMDGDRLWVHRWTAAALRERQGEEGARECSRRAGESLVWRAANVSHDLEDGIESARAFLDGRAFDRAVEMAAGVLGFMALYGQQADVAAFAAEVLETLPADHGRHYAICIAEADALLALGATDRAMARYRQANAVLAERALAEPGRADYQRDLSVSYIKLGDLYQANGQGEAARAAYQKDLEIAERLAKAEPGRADYQRDLSVSYERLGDLYQESGQGEAARTAYQQALEIAERLAKAEPGRADYQRDLSVSYIKLGDLYRANGQGEAAREAYQQALEIHERLARAEPGRADYQRDLSVSYNKLGDLYRANGQGEAARAAFQQSLEIRERLAKAEPGRADYQRDLSVSYNKLGDLYQANGQGEAARAAYQQSLEIHERLARAEPGRADYQRDISVSYERLGDLYRANGQGEAARAAFQQSLEIRERLAKAEPGRADYQRDLSVSYNKLGDLYQANGQGEAARAAYQKDLEIAERLARAEPGRADYQRDLSVSYNKLGDLYRANGQGEAARAAYQKDLEIAERLAKAEPGRADYQRDLSVSYIKLGDLYQANGQGEAARAAYQKNLEIAERLAKAEPGRADYQRDLSVSYERLGDLYRESGQGEAARAAFQQSLEIHERLAKAEPGRADYQMDLVAPLERMAHLAPDGGAEYLERLLEILRRLDAAGSLYPAQRAGIAVMEERLRQARQPARRGLFRRLLGRLRPRP